MEQYEWLKTYAQSQLEEMYMHGISGEINSMEGWIYAYQAEELEERSLSVEEAWSKDLYSTLYPVELIDGEWRIED